VEQKKKWKCPRCGRWFSKLDALSTDPVLPWHYNDDDARDFECPGTHRPPVMGGRR